MIALFALALANAATAAPVIVTSRVETAATIQSEHEVLVPAPAPNVWTAISSANGWRGWAATQAWTPADQPQLIETSYLPQAAPGAPANIKSLIILKVPERLLVFRTVKAPAGFADFEALAAVTWLIELEPADGGTRVRLIGSGYPRTPAGERILRFFLKGNLVVLTALRDSFRPHKEAGRN